MSETATTSDDPLHTGHYAKKQLFSRSALVNWSHGRRFRLARELVAPYAGQRLLDYGCGDASFLVMVADLFPDAVGADLNGPQIADCAKRLASLKGLTFLVTPQLKNPQHDHSYGVVTCMETLEHCLDDVQAGVVEDLRRLVRPDGIVIISVPIETGLTLPLKQISRRILGWRKIGEYRYNERYTLGELLKMTFATSTTQFERPVQYYNPSDPTSAHHGHKGFNWRRLRRRLEAHFEIKGVRFSPLEWTRGLMSSQCWYICRPK